MKTLVLELLVGFGLVACSAPASVEPPAGEPVRTATTVVARRPVERLHEASGTVRGRNTAILTSRVVANVRDVLVQPGDRVVAGQVLVLLDDADLQAARRRARAALGQASEGRREAENALRAAEAGARLAEVTHGRMERLFETSAITQQAFDESDEAHRRASAQRDTAAARLRGAAAAIDEAEAALSGAAAELAHTRITAPFGGRVIDRRVDPGSQAAPGQPLLWVEQEGAIRVEVAIDESHASSVHPDEIVHVELEAASVHVQGRVTEIVPSVDPASRAFMVKVELPAASQGTLRPGMFARVRFPIGTEPRLTIPASAVAPAGQLDRVFVVEGERARVRIVTLAARRGELVEVLSGLSAGERIVATPPPGLRDGVRIDVTP